MRAASKGETEAPPIMPRPSDEDCAHGCARCLCVTEPSTGSGEAIPGAVNTNVVGVGLSSQPCAALPTPERVPAPGQSRVRSHEAKSKRKRNEGESWPMAKCREPCHPAVPPRLGRRHDKGVNSPRWALANPVWMERQDGASNHAVPNFRGWMPHFLHMLKRMKGYSWE